MNQSDRLDYLIHYMQQENNETELICENPENKFEQFRRLANIRPPKPLGKKFLMIQNVFLQEYNDMHITDFNTLSPIKRQIYMWKGDITTLKIDAIVNAANSEMLGCMIPNHNCIDNIIHTKAGAELRLECNKLMEYQGKKEAVGRAKITKGYNLPAKYILHTVGPYIRNGKVSNMNRDLLKKCYQSCLELADEKHLRHIAFCSISTGVFGFPKKEAAKIAINTVENYLKETNSKIQVVFNVYSKDDSKIYQDLLK